MNYITDTLLTNEILILILIITVIIGFHLFIKFYVNFYLPFIRERDYIKMEMIRSYDEEEYLHWKKRLKELYISRIPIIRSIVRRKDR